LRYEPWNPFANGDGYVRYPNVDPDAEYAEIAAAAAELDRRLGRRPGS